MVGEVAFIACHILNRLPMKNKEKTPYEESVREDLHMGLFGQSEWGNK
jgi:hypothetical protein